MELPYPQKSAIVFLVGAWLLAMTAGGCRPAEEPVKQPEAAAPATMENDPEEVTKAEEKASKDQAADVETPKPSPEGNEVPEPAPGAEAEEPKPETTKELAEKPASDAEGLQELEPSPGLEPSMEMSAGAETDASEEPAPETSPAPRDLGPPLVDNADQLVQLHPVYPVWFDKEHKSVVLLGEVCQRQMPLELFACLRGSKEHEAIISVPAQAYVVHAGLLAAGAEPGNPVQFYPEYVPARGTEIEVTVLWKDEKGEIQRARGQDWVRHIESRKPMEYPWVFAGSQFVKDEQTGEQYYRADGEGDLICVSNFPTAVLDLPIKSSDANANLLYECFTERIPPVGTPVTLVLTPKPEPPAEATAGPEAIPEDKPSEPGAPSAAGEE